MSERIRARRLPIELAESLGSLSEKDEGTDPTHARFVLELLRDVLENGLTKKQKCYIILYYRDNLTMEQIAAKYGVNKSTVSRTVNAARRKINERVLRFVNKRI